MMENSNDDEYKDDYESTTLILSDPIAPTVDTIAYAKKQMEVTYHENVFPRTQVTIQITRLHEALWL
ncbi:hypothetical protein PsorP6_015281 [Peronosclerospora sorghi]|uniref:Uncharacterized protein n=1 Tax=Peronosclerospora sorghi TaxID=230839 RepID=A0ACC0VTU8_9STRA|nr:hypothetical protein PsorP6_015281 [Peronosclerospora sorghi]